MALLYYRSPMITDFGPMANPRLCVFVESDVAKFRWQVLFKSVDDGEYSVEKIEPCLEQLRPLSGYKVCSGIKEYPHKLRFQTKNLRQWGIPFNRVDAKSCELWHIPHNIHHPTGDKLRDTCQPCRLLHHDILKLVEKASTLTEEQMFARSIVQPNYPLKYLSPTSKALRVNKICKDRVNWAAKLSKVAHFDCDIGDKQPAELLEVVRTVNKNGSKVIEELCAKSDHLLGVDNNSLREVWHQDVVERLDFEKD